MLLALVMCFGLLTMVAAADAISDVTDPGEDNGFRFNLNMFKKSFELPDTITQLLDMFNLSGVWNFVIKIVNTIRGIDSMI